MLNNCQDDNLKLSLLMKSIAQQRMGEHGLSMDTITLCINQFPDFKDSYLVRGHKYLLKSQNQKALQDFIKFEQITNTQLSEMQGQSNPNLNLLCF